MGFGPVPKNEQWLKGRFYHLRHRSTIKQLYYEYFAETLRRRTKLKEGMYEEISRAVVSMAVDNDLGPFLRLVEKVIGRLSVRDARNFNESNLKAIFATLLTPSNVYLIRSETEMERRFVDLLCTTTPASPAAGTTPMKRPASSPCLRG